MQPAWSTPQVKAAILNNAEPDVNLSGFTVTGGRLNVCRAMPGCTPAH